jgi:DNA-binding transcriptional MerR regulator
LMRDLTSPLLSQRTVAGLVGVSQATIRRWEEAGILSGPGRRSASRLYSWREVERLQRAAYFVKARRISVAQVKRLLNNGLPGPQDADWIRTRPAPRLRQRRSGRGGVRVVALPRSARRKRRARTGKR